MAVNVQLRTSVKSPPQSVNREPMSKRILCREYLRILAYLQSSFPFLLPIPSLGAPPQPTAHLNPFRLLGKHSKSSKEGKSCRVNKKTSYEGKKKKKTKPWNHLVRKKKKNPSLWEWCGSFSWSLYNEQRVQEGFREHTVWVTLLGKLGLFFFFWLLFLSKYKCNVLVAHLHLWWMVPPFLRFIFTLSTHLSMCRQVCGKGPGN